MKSIYLNFFINVFICSLFLSIKLNAQIPTNGLVACYPFAGSANDMSGNNHHGTNYGATLTTDRFGRLNNAYSFNGTSSYISLPFTPFNLQSFSYSAWAYATAYPGADDQGCLISIGSYGGDHGFALCNSYSTGGAKGWGFGSYFIPVPNHYWGSQGILPPLNTWFYLVLTRDGNYIKFYINGQLINSQQTNGTIPYYGSGSPLANIGRRSQLAINQFFTGKIDDIHIYNRALTATEVNTLYIGELNAVTITAVPGTTINQGENVTFTATINGIINNPTYQWQVNGTIVGGNSPTYSSTNLNNGDVVRCLVIPSGDCDVPVFSNSLTMIVTYPPLSGLVACYPFTGNANDMSGNNHHGTNYGATLTTDRFGRLNNAYSFNGTSSYISLPFTPFNLQSFSYSTWAYVTAYPAANDQNCVISIGSYGGDHCITLSNIYSTGGAVGWLYLSYYGSGFVHGWPQGTLPSLNTWYHLVLTRDGSCINCYINGQLVYTHSTVGTSPYYGSGTPLANIGRRSHFPLNQFFNGKIDDIHIYNRALTATEVNTLYNGELNTVSITANPGTTICTGTPITFTATINGTISNPIYQWQLNGVNVGTNTNTYTNTTLANGDNVRCLVFSDQTCESPNVSNSLIINVSSTLPLSVNITASPGNNICEGTNVIFTATGINGGSNATFQWKVNGINVGTNSNTFSINTLLDGDQVSCVYSSPLSCATNNPATSNVIQMVVNPSANLNVSIVANPGNNICEGTNVIFTATGINGGNNALYQWKINEINVGTNTNILSVDTLSNGSVITCVYSSSLLCSNNNPATSNGIHMYVGNNLPLSIGITAIPGNIICKGNNNNPVIFNANGVNGGNNVTYQWKINGIPVGNNTPVLTVDTLTKNASVSCSYTSNLLCVTNNPANSNTIYMIILSGPKLDAGESVQITPPEGTYLNPVYSGGSPPYQFSWNPGNSLTNPYIANPYATPNNTTTYTLSVTDAFGCITQDTVTIYVSDIKYDVFIPNTFSPNGDNENDVLYVRGNGLNDIEFYIFDRWGEKVFSSYSLDIGWDGSYKGKKLNPAVFAYYFKAKTLDNKKIDLKGNITLIK